MTSLYIYRVTPTGIEELIEVYHPNATSSYEFEITGDGLITNHNTNDDVLSTNDVYAFATTGPYAGIFHEPYVFDNPQLMDANRNAKPKLLMRSKEDLTRSLPLLEIPKMASFLSVDSNWLRNLPISSFPVVIDPSLQLSPSYAVYYERTSHGT